MSRATSVTKQTPGATSTEGIISWPHLRLINYHFFSSAVYQKDKNNKKTHKKLWVAAVQLARKKGCFSLNRKWFQKESRLKWNIHNYIQNGSSSLSVSRWLMAEWYGWGLWCMLGSPFVETNKNFVSRGEVL